MQQKESLQVFSYQSSQVTTTIPVELFLCQGSSIFVPAFLILGDTDMGGKKPKNILSKGIFYGHLEPL